jgi:hypothetical protein
MCWNQAVSLNTFLFSCFVLALIIYNNVYTQYKIQELNSFWVYVFIFSIISMQLVEFFIWRNIKNAFYNRAFTWIANLLLLSQPAFSLMLLPNIQLKTVLVSVYLVLVSIYVIHQMMTFDVHSTVSKMGHLQWNTSKLSQLLIWVVWLFFFSFSLVYLNKIRGILFGAVLLLVSYYNFSKDNTMGSMWCWFINFAALYCAFVLLFYLPFIKDTIGH